MITFVLPWPPSLNHHKGYAIGNVRNSAVVGKLGYKTKRLRVYLTKHGRQYRDHAIAIIRRAMWDARVVLGDLPLKGELYAALDYRAPDQRTRDLDNLQKVVFDAITHAGLWADDHQVGHYEVRRGDVTPGGTLTVTVRHR